MFKHKIVTTVIISLILLCTSCSSQTKKQDDQERIRILTSYTSNDEFMTLFMQFVRENSLAGELIRYENELISKEYLAGYDEISVKTYFKGLISGRNKDRCVSQPVMDKIAPVLPEFTYDDYKTGVEQNRRKGSKEYTFLEYMKNNGVNFEASLQYALQDNELTPDKKYFYLLFTMPYKVCEE